MIASADPDDTVAQLLRGLVDGDPGPALLFYLLQDDARLAKQPTDQLLVNLHIPLAHLASVDGVARHSWNIALPDVKSVGEAGLRAAAHGDQRWRRAAPRDDESQRSLDALLRQPDCIRRTRQLEHAVAILLRGLVYADFGPTLCFDGLNGLAFAPKEPADPLLLQLQLHRRVVPMPLHRLVHRPMRRISQWLGGRLVYWLRHSRLFQDASKLSRQVWLADSVSDRLDG
mmetsp:Transcript_6300/g.15670  ORF Transcript_6300/g.15670 Transcript_6300/m.15670 type:complete len:229 (+) Transcript_6300:242-928(+)